MAIDLLRGRLLRGEVSARELVEEHIKRISEVDPSIHAFLKVTSEKALLEADQIDKCIASGNPLPPLAGVPVAIKDNLNVQQDL